MVEMHPNGGAPAINGGEFALINVSMDTTVEVLDMKRIYSLFSVFLTLSVLALWTADTSAFPTYSKEDGTGNCKMCHGDFRQDDYVSRTDGKNWGNLHDLHRLVMMAEDGPANKCATCHTVVGRRPVFTNSSLGNGVWDPISCVGCHGRYEDHQDEHEPAEFNAGNGHETHGMGAGLRQHHWTAGITYCGRCHEDADPAEFATAGEDVLPPYYFLPDPDFYNKPTDPCNINGEEDYAGLLWGLDNDGDGKYDMQDSDCTPPEMITVCHLSASGVDGARTISINLNALPGHAEHGDLLGSCEG